MWIVPARVWRRGGGVLAPACLILATVLATPAYAADGPDLQAGVDSVTFGAGSSIVFHTFQVSNAGPADATGVHVTIDLLSDTATPALTFPGQISGCTVVSPSELRCPMPDLAAGANSTQDFVAKAVEAHHVPGNPTPQPMSMKVKVIVSADQTDAKLADNTLVSGPILRTVQSSPTDWAAASRPLNLNDVDSDNNIPVFLGAADRGPAGTALAEGVETFTAPPGTEWVDSPAFDVCAPIIPKIKYQCTIPASSIVTQGPIPLFHTMLHITATHIGVGSFEIQSLGGETNPNDNIALIAVAGSQPTTTPTTVTPTAAAQPALPNTGVKTRLIATIGAAAALIGATLVVFTRRRRRPTES